MELAKPHVDVGLFTNEREAMLEFWQKRIGLPFEEPLPVGGGVLQLRHDMNGSVLKINHARDPLPGSRASGYRSLEIARRELAEVQELTDPDGNRVTLVPRGFEGVEGIRVDLGVRDPDAFHRFYGHVLRLPAAGADSYRCGDSLLAFAPDAEAGGDAEMQGRGYRYLTIQVRDVDDEHRSILERGGAEGRPPATLGKVARISFVRDPDGNWIELSQRASLTGPLAS